MPEEHFITLKSINLEIPTFDLCILIAAGTFTAITLIIVLNMDNSPLTQDIIRRYGEDIRTGAHDKPNQVDLTFMSIGTDGSKPDQLIYDKNDPVGAKLPVLFPNKNLVFKYQEINGTMFRGLKIPYKFKGSSEIGILDYECHNRYYITAPAPASPDLILLRARGISVISGDLPLVKKVHEYYDNKGHPRTVDVVYIYGDQKSAQGVYKTEYSVYGEFYNDIHKK